MINNNGILCIKDKEELLINYHLSNDFFIEKFIDMKNRKENITINDFNVWDII